MGGGLGHLTRVQTFIKNKGISGPLKVITANRSAFNFFDEEEVAFMDVDESTNAEELRKLIKRIAADLTFEALYIDTFPYGILGELTSDTLPAKTRHLLARRIIWKNYLPLMAGSRTFNTTFRFEPLESGHQQFIADNSKMIIDINLEYRGHRDLIFQKPFNKPLWLIVHSSHREELLLRSEERRERKEIRKRW